MTRVYAERYVEAASELLDLPIAAEWRPGVARFLGMAAEMAAMLDAVALDEDDLAPAPVFRLPDPDAQDD